MTYLGREKLDIRVLGVYVITRRGVVESSKTIRGCLYFSLRGYMIQENSCFSLFCAINWIQFVSRLYELVFDHLHYFGDGQN